MDRKELSRTFTVSNKLGIHARPASLLAKTANQFSADVTISKDGTDVDAKSILGLLMLAAGFGSEVSFRAQGEDAAEALDALEKLISEKFGEE